MLDCSPAKIHEYRARYGADLWQLRTPLTKYALAGVPYGLENGCFGGFIPPAWERLLEEAEESRPVFVTVPDVVGDAQRTAELFEHYQLRLNGLPRALVLQNGIERVRIPWNDIVGVFIGGDDAFKVSREAFAAARTARMLGKWVHVGRVNTAARCQAWLGIAHSLDGSGVSRFDHMLEDVLRMIEGDHPQQQLPVGA